MMHLILATLACIWSYGTNLRGDQVTLEEMSGKDIVEHLQQEQTKPKTKPRRNPQLEKSGANFEQRNDYAVTLLQGGDYPTAIAILRDIEQHHPGHYATAANLGTAYELSGNDQEALTWIRHSIVRNPDAHAGSEWLHVRILEAKLAMARNPDWLKKHSILGIELGDGPLPKMPSPLPAGNDGKPVTVEDLKMAIWSQLRERYQFVKAPDPVVGSLLFDWANVSFRTELLESAIALYREAIRYGAPRSELAKVRLAKAEQILRDHTARQKK